MFTNRYIFTYASIMVILVAAVLSTASMVLKPFQEANVKAEKIQGILAAASIETSRADAAETYSKYVVEELAVDSEGNVVSIFKNNKAELGNIRPFDIDLKVQLNLKKELAEGKSVSKPVWSIFVMEKNGERSYVVPVRGTGLWGPIWGNIAFKSDFNTILGATFDHKGETPGLGAEISKPEFGEMFIGKTIFDENGKFVSVKVVKGGVKSSNVPLQHGVDAISGGTITSNGVSAMVYDCLENYVPYIEKNK